MLSRIQTVEAIYAAMKAADWAALDRLLSEDVEWRQNPGFPGGGVHIGVPAVVRNVFEGNAGRWSSFGFRRDAIWDTGTGVVVTGAYVVVAKGSEETVEADTCHVFFFKGSRVSAFQQYSDTKTLWDAYGAG